MPAQRHTAFFCLLEKTIGSFVMVASVSVSGFRIDILPILAIGSPHAHPVVSHKVAVDYKEEDGKKAGGGSARIASRCPT